ncbi:cilia- and flagella-associated protein 61 isoform X1 [Lampetra fluviatilis]
MEAGMIAGGAMEGVCARRTESSDVHHLESLVSPATEHLFGRVVPVSLIEKANLAVTLCNDTNEIIAHAAFLDYPNTACVDQAEWPSWMCTHYDSGKCTPLNTLFMHYFVAKADVEADCAKQIIRTVFNAVPDLHFVFLLLKKNASPGAVLENIFTRMKMHGHVSDPAGSLYVCHRHNHFPILHIRQARQEDHDDLLPIFSKQSLQLRNTYGEFFLVELIEAQDQNSHTAVAEVDGVGVGFMSVHSEVNIALLNDCFELIPFHGLCKAHPDDITEPNSETSKQYESDAEQPERNETDLRPDSVTSHFSLPSQQPQISQPPEVSDKENQADSQAVESGGSLASEGEADSSADNAGTRSQQVESLVDIGSKTMILQPPSKADVIVSEAPAFRPVYMGASNAFCIQLFCIDEKYEMRSQDFLPYVFNIFPDKNYCIMTVPHPLPEFPLLHSLMRVTPRSVSGFSQELYVVHRSALHKSMVVRAARSNDSDAVKSLVETLDQHKLLLADFNQFNQARRDPNGTQIRVYVAEMLEKIVGVAVVRAEEDIEYIRSHYNIEDFIYYSHHRRDQHAHLCHFVLNPAAYLYTKHFLKEVLRLSHCTSLYYPVYPGYSKKSWTEKHHTLSSVLHCLVPVRPRSQISYPLHELGENSPSQRVLMEQDKYALNHFNRKLTLEPKVTVNARIVVVGASDTGISFLETLAFCPHLRFNNLTLISTHGLPGELPPCPIREGFLASSHCYSTNDLALLSLHSRVSVVVGKVTAINRSAKHVVTGGGHVSYDHLILCTGQQYEVPCPTEADLSKLLTNAEVPNSPDRRYSGPVPANLFTLNDQDDCQHALEWLRRNFLGGQGNAIVYGSSLDAYTTVQTLLKLCVAGSRIHLAEPPHGYTVCCFNNFAVESAIRGALLQAGVKVHSSCLLAHWNENAQQSDLITSASFTTDTKPFSLECSAFFAFYRKGVDYEAFRAANDSCLVFDGRLVIDASFCTSDGAVRAAGTLTKYARRYYADHAAHAGYNSKEVGFHLAAGVLPLLDPTLEPPSSDDLSDSLNRLVPTFTAPNIQGGILPGGYQYLHIVKPGVVIPLEAQMARPDYGRELVTGRPEDGDYFRLHVGRHGTVETLTCLSAKPLPSSNYVHLYGQHEQLLNKLLSRFDEGLIPDLYSYFRQPWCMAIFHDRFQDLQRELRQLVSTAQAESGPSMLELATQLVQGDLSLLEGGPQSLDEQFKKLGYKKAVETRLISYLQYNHYHLPMYFRPGII